MNCPKALCPSCDGSGGWDRSTDCEVYDDWIDCTACDGAGMVDEDFDD